MVVCRCLLVLLFYVQPLQADSYWSHMPGFGSVKLTEMEQEQHNALSEHLSLSQQQTKQWLDDLSAQLKALSCSTTDAQSQPLPAYVAQRYFVVSYAGVLKFESNDERDETVWWLPWSLLPFLSQLKAELGQPDRQVHQPLLLNEQELGQHGQFILVSGTSNQSPSYFALRLSPLHLPELLWSVSADVTGFEGLAGTASQPLMLREQHRVSDTSSLSVLLANTGVTEQKALVYKVDAYTGKQQGLLKMPKSIYDLSGAMTVYDQNRDSIPDSLIFSSRAGQIWQAKMENHRFHDITPVADLSGFQPSDIQFIRTLYAAVPIGGSGADFHSRRSQWLVLLGLLQRQKSIFVVLKPKQSAVPDVYDFVDRTLAVTSGLIALTDHELQLIQQKDGWSSRLTGRLTQPPIVAAGVLYLTVLTQDPAHFCSIEHSYSAFMALHLHHASPVYRQPLFPLDRSAGALVIKSNKEGGFVLIEQNHQQVLIDNLLEISPNCTYCSKPLQKSSFPRWQLMGTYQNEEGVY